MPATRCRVVWRAPISRPWLESLSSGLASWWSSIFAPPIARLARLRLAPLAIGDDAHHFVNNVRSNPNFSSYARDFLEPYPQPLELPPAYRTLLRHAISALREHIELAALRQQFHLHARSRLMPWPVQQLLLVAGEPILWRADQVLHRGDHTRASLAGPLRLECPGPSPRS